MAAELDTKQDGAASIFSVRETPWHGEGVVLSEAPATVGDALSQSGLDWEVEKRPAAFRLPGGDYMDVPGQFAVVRTDREQALGIVGSYYRPVQNRDAFRVLQPLIDEGVAAWETAGALREGRDVWGLIRFRMETPILQEVFGGDDRIDTFGLIANNHAGNRCLMMAATPIRVVCANTLTYALGLLGAGKGRGVPVRHTAGAEVKLVEAAHDLWGKLITRMEGAARQYRLLRGTFLDEALFARLVLDAAIPLPEYRPNMTARQRSRVDTARANAESRRARVRVLWTAGAGHTGDLSAWEAVNGLIEAVDHEPETFPTRRASRAEGLMVGTLGEVKVRAMTGLVNHALSLSA